MAEEVNVETKLVKDVGPVEDVVIPVALPVPKPTSVNSRRLSTGAVGTRAGNKPQVKSRYRGDHHVTSIHDHCKHGTHVKRCDHDDVVKPWKIVRRKSVEASETVKAETSGLRKKSLASTKPESSVAAKRDAVPVKKTPLTGSDVVKKVRSLGNEKSSYVMKKVSRISDAEGSKVSAPKNKEKAKTQTISGEDVKEKTVCVVEASVKGVQSGDTELEADQTLEKKMRSKRMSSVKVNPANQLSFKKGKTLELRHEDSSPKWIKFRKKVVQEMKPQTEGRKKKLKGIETRSDSCEGSKREKVVLRHQKVEGKKKMMTLFNNVIEETMNKLTKVRKTKVKALIGAFETVISLQDTKTPQSKDTTFSSKV